MGFVTQPQSTVLGSQKLMRVDNRAVEYPQDRVEYYSPMQVGDRPVKRQHFHFETTISAFSWSRNIVPAGVVQKLIDHDVTFRTADPDPIWGKHATSNPDRWWYVRVKPSTNRIVVEMAGHITGVKGWVDYVEV